MGRCVITGYRPKAGKRPELHAAIAKYLETLGAQGLLAERQPQVLASLDETIVVIVEWKSAEAIEKAHRIEAVTAAWSAFGELCDYRPLASLREASEMFAEFDTLSI